MSAEEARDVREAYISEDELTGLFEMAEAEGWPEPTSDCDEAEHYAALLHMGACPYCGQEVES